MSSSNEESDVVDVVEKKSPQLAAFSMHDIILFAPQEVERGKAFRIELRPRVREGFENEEVLLHRIVMHRSCCTRFSLVQILVGTKPRTQMGNGSCEIFLAEVPNLQPQDIVFSHDKPLILLMRNMSDLLTKVVGTAVIWRKP